MARYLDPKTDLTFQKVFGEHEEILKSFLNSVLPLPKDSEIESLNYLTPELIPKTPEGKYSIVDVRCTDNIGRTFIVEMQMYWTESFKRRVLFNACKAYSYPAEKGTQFNELKKVYSLNLVNAIAFEDYPNDYYHIFTLTHHKYNELKIDDMMLIFIELPKFNKQSTTNTEQMSLWLRFLTEINGITENISPDFKNNSYISKAIELVEESAYSNSELLAIDKYWDSVSIERTLIDEISRTSEARGEAKGKAEGKAEGRVEGRVEVAKKMKIKNMPICDIVELTGLTEEEISKL